MKKIIYTLLSLLSLACILSWGMYYLYSRTYQIPYQYPRLTIHNPIEGKYNLIKLGNSHSLYGLDFSHYNTNSLSLAESAQPFSYDLAKLKMYKNQIAEHAIVLISISPNSFIKDSEFIDGFQDQYYDDYTLSPFLIPQLNVQNYLVKRLFPFLSTMIFIRQRYAEPSKEVLQNVVKQNIQTGYYNVSSIRDQLEDSNHSDTLDSQGVEYMANKWNQFDEMQEIKILKNTREFKRLLAYCIQQNWLPVLITIPVSESLLNRLKPQFMDEYVYMNIKIPEAKNVLYLDFTKYTPITSNYDLFEDPDHLNKKGAAIFSYILLRKLIDSNILSQEVDRYIY